MTLPGRAIVAISEAIENVSDDITRSYLSLFFFKCLYSPPGNGNNAGLNINGSLDGR
jgi:hypothetical protein